MSRFGTYFRHDVAHNSHETALCRSAHTHALVLFCCFAALLAVPRHFVPDYSVKTWNTPALKEMNTPRSVLHGLTPRIESAKSNLNRKHRRLGEKSTLSLSQFTVPELIGDFLFFFVLCWMPTWLTP